MTPTRSGCFFDPLLRLLSVVLLFVTCAAHAETPPQVIRFGSPEISTNRALAGGVIVGIANEKGWLRDEFGKDNVRLEFDTFRNGAPAVGQALANRQLDFAVQGDLMSVIGHAAGLPTTLLLPSVKLGNAYLAVPPQSSIARIADLRGKKVAYFKGNFVHLQVLRILAANGMSEKDIRSVFLDPPTSIAALASGDVDAVFGGPELLPARDRGALKIVYTTRGQSPTLTAQSGFIARTEFVKAYPQTTQRIVDVLVKTARWASDPANKDQVFALWSTDGQRRADLEEDYSGRPISDRMSPLIDPFFVGRYQATLDQAAALGFLHGPKFDVEQWIDRRFLQSALTRLGLNDYWQPLDVHGERARP
ncbi:bacterial extracellular solute-binding s, 3 family protein [Paraburkholderia xenovorans LB400]|nr:ABC transporter substrate-binding protein [Paraburkholderia xenovorans]AIP34758.1 bacterial extracellular solute-binding s, 3 family protein [Paraburkholderia xenovorans LB400]